MTSRSDQERVIYFGPPGTGKTTRLLEHARDAIEVHGIPPHRIAFVAFSRKAAREARTRATEELGLIGDDLQYWRTLHSTAARQLAIRPGELVVGEHWKALGEMLDLDFGEMDEAGRVGEWGRDRGRAIQHAYSLHRARNEPLDLASLIRAHGESNGLLVDQFVRTLSVYKQTYGLLDYTDLLSDAPGNLPVDVAFIDEAQDLTPAQWDYALRLVASASVVYVAGDDDQAIFDWAGADVSRFLSLPGERRVLGESHRLPRTVYQRAVNILSRIKLRQPKTWGPADRDGDVSLEPEPDAVDVTKGQWLLLARTRWMMDRWENTCRLAGVRYVKGDRDSVHPNEARAIRAWETARRGVSVSGEDIAPALALARVGREIKPDEAYSLADLGYPAAPPWREAMIRIPLARREYYERCLRLNPRALTDPAQVTISTVHGAKGGEADNVALLTDMTPRIEAGMFRNADAEHRVWYVAATRAKQRLVLVRPTTDTSYFI